VNLLRNVAKFEAVKNGLCLCFTTFPYLWANRVQPQQSLAQLIAMEDMIAGFAGAKTGHPTLSPRSVVPSPTAFLAVGWAGILPQPFHTDSTVLPDAIRSFSLITHRTNMAVFPVTTNIFVESKQNVVSKMKTLMSFRLNRSGCPDLFQTLSSP
jgi:hypothetical protein